MDGPLVLGGDKYKNRDRGILMTRLGINTGGAPNDGQGDPLRIAMGKINLNFQEVYNSFGDGDNLISYASTAGISTVSRNLTGSPIINISGQNNSGVNTSVSTQTSNLRVSGITTSIGGFTSNDGGKPVYIQVSGNNLILTVLGVGATTLRLY